MLKTQSGQPSPLFLTHLCQSIRIQAEKITQNELSLGLLKAVYADYPEAVYMFIEAGADVNSRSGSGTALTEAIYLESDEVASILLQAGASISIPEAQSNYLPLHLAVYEGKLTKVKLTKVKLLIEYGADVNEVHDERFALLEALTEEYEEIFKYLFPLTCTRLQQEAEAYRLSKQVD